MSNNENSVLLLGQNFSGRNKSRWWNSNENQTALNNWLNRFYFEFLLAKYKMNSEYKWECVMKCKMQRSRNLFVKMCVQCNHDWLQSATVKSMWLKLCVFDLWSEIEKMKWWSFFVTLIQVKKNIHHLRGKEDKTEKNELKFQRKFK